ncbi:MAG TPA: regulatory protein RecX [Gemmatimonadaceae bacterium]|nr:regulatory protein RecX [Gemmatimonadaceae bacterium]
MELITDITESPRRPGRYVVSVAGRPGPTVSVETIERWKLAVGQPWEPVGAAVEREGTALATYDRALNMLAARARSRRELERLLVRKGEPADLAREAIRRLEQAGYLDDAEFARQFARAKALGAGLARRRLAAELGRRGVERAVADRAVDEVFVDERVDEREGVERLVRKRLASLAGLDPATRRRRLYAYLARRGYGPDLIRVAIERIDSERESETDGEPV